MKRLQGAAKRAHARKVQHDAMRNKDIAHKRNAIAKMQASHKEVERWEYIGTMSRRTGLYVNVAGNLSKIAYNSIKLVVSSCIVILCLALTVKALFILSRLF